VTGNGSAFEFPCDVPVKVFGRNEAAFRDAVIGIVRIHFPEFRERDLEQRLSRQDHYLSLTINLRVETRNQIDALYTELSAHEAVLMVL
jgi:hypothetical protein